MLALTLWRHASLCFRYFLQTGKKNANPRKVSCSFGGRTGVSTAYSLSALSFALLVFQSKEKKKKSPKTLIPGEVKRKLIFTIKFFIDSKVHVSTCIQSTEAAGRTKHQRKIADQNLLNCLCPGAACFSSWWQSPVIDNVLPRGLNPFFPCMSQSQVPWLSKLIPPPLSVLKIDNRKGRQQSFKPVLPSVKEGARPF